MIWFLALHLYHFMYYDSKYMITIRCFKKNQIKTKKVGNWYLIIYNALWKKNHLSQNNLFCIIIETWAADKIIENPRKMKKNVIIIIMTKTGRL